MVVFGDRQCRHRYITIYDTRIEVVDTFKFLGVMFSKNRQFTLAKRLSVDQAKKAMFSVYKKIRNLDLPIDWQLKLFDSIIVPILKYGCEVCGFGNLKMIEKCTQISSNIIILNVKQGTPHSMLYGELGRFPLYIVINKSSVVVFGIIYSSVVTGCLQLYIALFSKSL